MRVVDGVHRFGRDGVNWYIVEGDSGLTIVDAGFPRHWGDLTAYLNRSGIPSDELRAIVLTHAHADHVGFAEHARREGATVHAHRDEVDALRARPSNGVPERFRRHLWRPKVLVKIVGWTRRGVLSVPAVDEVAVVADGDVVDVPGRPTALHTPGHTPGSATYVFGDHGVACTGDAFVTMDPVTGRPGIGVAPTGLNHDDEQALASVRRLGDLGVDVLLPGHGEPYRHGVAGAVQAALAIGAGW